MSIFSKTKQIENLNIRKIQSKSQILKVILIFDSYPHLGQHMWWDLITQNS